MNDLDDKTDGAPADAPRGYDGIDSVEKLLAIRTIVRQWRTAAGKVYLERTADGKLMTWLERLELIGEPKWCGADQMLLDESDARGAEIERLKGRINDLEALKFHDSERDWRTEVDELIDENNILVLTNADLVLTNKDSDMSKRMPLKPCPFCGGKARMERPMGTRYYYVFCTECAARILAANVREDACKIWNRRATP
jgi:Lar family restriction alleviation protein